MSGNKSLLLDTNIVIGIFKGQIELQALIKENYNLVIPSVVLGELYYGCFNSSNPTKHLDQINSFVKEITILDSNDLVCLAYGGIKSVLKKNGTPIPENDIWIAAYSQAYEIVLLSLDAHFDLIPDLKHVKSL